MTGQLMHDIEIVCGASEDDFETRMFADQVFILRKGRRFYATIRQISNTGAKIEIVDVTDGELNCPHKGTTDAMSYHDAYHIRNMFNTIGVW